MRNYVLAAATTTDSHGCTISGPMVAGGEEIWDEATQQCIVTGRPNCGTGYLWNATDKKCISVSGNATSSLIIDNGKTSDTSAATTRGEVTYSSHNVQVKASNIKDYTLTITGPTNLSGTTTIGSAGTNVAGSSITNNKWGYAWGDISAANANMIYNGFTGSAQTLDNNTTTAISDGVIDFTKKLVFAVKFGDDAASGHYKAGVTLNLTATPAAVNKWSTGVDSGITTMQEMTSNICNQVAKPAAGATIPTLTLKDSRDQNEYTIARLTDGNCWMITNMILDLSKTNLTPTDSDVSSIYTKGTATSAGSSWVNDNTKAQFYNIMPSNYYYQYGYYYSWCAATAGTCSSAAADGAIAPNSICPKGWKLPLGGSTKATNTPSSQTGNDFVNLAIGDGASIGTLSYSTSIQKTLSSATPKYITLGGSSWYAAGSVSSYGLLSSGSYVEYWSRSAFTGTFAYRLDFMNSDNALYFTHSSNRYPGLPIRCIAYAN